MPTKTETLKKYLNHVLIETGSYLGDGIQAALDAGYKKVLSIELADKYYFHCMNRFNGDNRVTLFKGDSCDMLFDMIKDINGSMTFWLDGHYSCGETAKGKFSSPLMAEIEQISRRHIKSHSILVDDMRCWIVNHPEAPDIQFNEEIIKEAILSINKNYRFSYEDGYIPNDILVAIT